MPESPSSNATSRDKKGHFRASEAGEEQLPVIEPNPRRLTLSQTVLPAIGKIYASVASDGDLNNGFER
jgi:hypothetical protein